MGGGFYSQDVAREARSSNRGAFSYSGYTEGATKGRRSIDPAVNASGKIRECMNDTPIVVALDVTRSRGNDTKVMYEKLPTFMGQITLQGYVQGPGVSFCAVGDAASGDKAPLQVGQFEADNRLDKVLESLWIEEGGGGTGQESYELAAYYFARHAKLECLKKGRKGYFFFVGDEGFYPEVDRALVQSVLGFRESKNIPSETIFRELQEKFHVYLIYPRKTFEQRRTDIDAEIQQRVEAAGGQYKNVDIRASLIWNNLNDLDLHVVPPSGEEIFYGHKQSECGGWLDVDMNVRGETEKPVENVRWTKGTAPKGRYRLSVQNYRFHEKKHAPVDFRLEVEVNGEVRHFDGVISSKGETGGPSNVAVYEFDFDPKERYTEEEKKEVYANYSDEVILKQWMSVLPEGHVLRIDDPGAIVDVVLGALAIGEGKADLSQYLLSMKSRGEVDALREETARALGGLGSGGGASGDPGPGGGPQRGGATRRLS